MKNIAIFASGNGTNAENIARFFAHSSDVRIAVVLTNLPDVPVIERMNRLNIPVKYFPSDQWRKATPIVDFLAPLHIDLIVLAGFLAFIKLPIIDAYPMRIINIHPSLLPKFGGKGMWGDHVHEAVIAAGEKQSGITIHYVTADIDAGAAIAQFTCDVKPDDTPDSLAQRIHKLEYAHFPEVIAHILR